MGTGQINKDTQAKVTSAKLPKCSVCRKPIQMSCDWNQGRCPHLPSLAEQVIGDPYKSRFYNLLKLFTRKSK
jgi:hypothetical protein